MNMNVEVGIVVAIIIAVVAYFVIKRKKDSAPAAASPPSAPVAPPVAVAPPPAPVQATPVVPATPVAAPPAQAPVAAPATAPVAAPAPYVAPDMDKQNPVDGLPPGAVIVPTSAVASVMTPDEQMARAMLARSNDPTGLYSAIANNMAARGLSQEQIVAALNSFGGTAGANGGAQEAVIAQRYGTKYGDAFANTAFAHFFENK